MEGYWFLVDIGNSFGSSPVLAAPRVLVLQVLESDHLQRLQPTFAVFSHKDGSDNSGLDNCCGLLITWNPHTSKYRLFAQTQPGTDVLKSAVWHGSSLYMYDNCDFYNRYYQKDVLYECKRCNV